MTAATKIVNEEPITTIDNTKQSVEVKEPIQTISSSDKKDVLKLKSHIENYISTQPDFWKSWEEESGPEILAESIKIKEELLNDDHHMLRALTARKHDMKLSANLILNQVKWRAKWQPKDIQPSMIPHALKSEAWRLCGYSKEGCVISNYKLEFWKPEDYGPPPTAKTGYVSSYFSSSSSTRDKKNEGDDALDEYMRYIAYMLELKIAKMRPLPVPQQFIIMFDLKGFRRDMVFSYRARQMIGRLIYVAQSQYPERLRKVYMINAPYGFGTAWKLIKVLLDGKTASKVSFISGDLVEKMEEHVDAETLSITYGGKHEEYVAPSLTLSEEIEREIS